MFDFCEKCKDTIYISKMEKEMNKEFKQTVMCFHRYLLSKEETTNKPPPKAKTNKMVSN